MSWRGYAREVADALASQGYGSLASRMRACGTRSTVRTCNACGDPAASVMVHAGCNLRACPWCARRESRERARLVKGAAERVPGYVGLRRESHLAELAARVEKLDASRASSRRAERLARLRRAQHATRASAPGRAGWGWKLITISPQWDPTSPDGYTVAGLRARLDDVRSRWRALWSEGLSVEGLAGAYVRVELSARGHVHLHALYYGPWQSRRWLATVAGCFVDVRVVDEGGLREAVKYAVKAPTPTRAAFIGGESNTTLQPLLAARWVIASRSKRLAEPYGLMRDAMRAAEVCGAAEEDERAPEPCACASCGSVELDAGRSVRTAELARELAGRNAWEFHARNGLPARVSIGRAMPPRA